MIGGFSSRERRTVVLARFGHITLLDLDTIDLSNLTVNFYFERKT